MSTRPATNEPEWTIGRLLRWTADYLDQCGVADARLACEVLLAHAAECRRIDLYTRFDEVLSGAQIERFRGWVKRAAAREPIAYLVGEKEFFSLAFRVTPAVLIPRPETETLVETVLDYCRGADLNKPWLLDLGTGSGCIAIALLVQLKGATAVATDISPTAIALAKANAERHGVSERFTAVEADCLDLADEVVPDGGFDLLLSNPPYVARDEMDQLDASIRDHEPSEALTDGGDGLSFYRGIAANAASILTPDGVVLVEVGDGQAQTVIGTMVETGPLVHKRTWKDRVVGSERVVMFSFR